LIDRGAIEVTSGFPCGDHNSDGAGVLQIRPFNVTVNATITLDTQKHVPASAAAGRPTLETGDIVFNNTNTKELVGKTAVWNGTADSVFSNHMTRIRPTDSGISSLYLASAIHAHWVTGRSEMLARSHVAQASILGERFREIQIPWPKKSAQVIFADAFKITQDSIQIQSDIIETLSALKGTAMCELFSRGLRGEAQKDTEVGPVPKSWEIKTLAELCSISSGGTPRKSVSEYWNGDLPWVSGKDLKKPTLDDAIDHISEEGAAAGSKIAPADAVLILVRGMGLAKDLPIARISRPMAFNQDLKALTSKGQVTGAFLRSAIYNRKDALLSRIVPSAHGTMTLNLDDLESFKIGCPTDPDEISDITATLDAIDAKIDLHKRKKAVLEELFRSLLHKLMTGEIHVADLDMAALETKQEVAE
jgi:type I restriction enzyme S subunit